MPEANNIRIQIGDFEIETTDPGEIPVSISYSLEDADDFQSKTPGYAFDITVPATLNNSKAANTFYNASIQDLTNGEIFKNYQPASINASGYELLKGKGLLKKAEHRERPVSFTFNLYGDNADWVIDLKNITLYDLLQHITFVFNRATVEASWAFDGVMESLPYVFAPVRYREPFNGYKIVNNISTPQDDNITTGYLKPSLSKYFIIYWAFKSLGYKIDSKFFNTNYYRRMVMPWTFGNFLNSEGTRLDTHKFLAQSRQENHYDGPNGPHTQIFDLFVTNDSTDGAFDNNDDYSYNSVAKEMIWEYKLPNYGLLEATFSMSVYYNLHATGTSDVYLRVQWFKNGAMFPGSNGVFLANTGNMIAGKSANGIGGYETGIQEMFATNTVSPGDKISAKIHLYTFESSIGNAAATAKINFFKLDNFKIPLGGTIDFSNFTGFKKYKFLDFFAGECDLYNLSFNTDAVNKVVVIEPTHGYSLTNDLSQKNSGYFNEGLIDWENKKDLSQLWEMKLYSDSEREQLLKFKDDNNDGLLKLVQDRNQVTLSQGKYVLPDRFSTGIKERVNRFFSATMHYEADQFASLGTGVNATIAPQFIAIVPENISNTSNSESSNTFLPKSAWYKGLLEGIGAWRWEGNPFQFFPYMFAVNYKDGGENDPILSYSDEKIKKGNGYALGKGLLKRFYWQRFAIMSNGQWYTVHMRLNNYDIAGQLHREYKIIAGQKWQLITIDEYRVLKNEATRCLLYKNVPISQSDHGRTFPSSTSVLAGNATSTKLDTKYNPLKCLINDIPR